MKISGIEKIFLAVTAAFLLLTIGFFMGQRSGKEPYNVSAQVLWTSDVEEGYEQPSAPVERVNINTADETQLQTLPGIGQVRAEDIVKERETNGLFRIPEDITRVPGIGQGTLEEILDYITVN